MSRRKEKLVLKQANSGFVIAKSINTLEFGIPGTAITKEQAEKILARKATAIKHGDLTIEFVS